jgi:aminopeptidase N
MVTSLLLASLLCAAKPTASFQPKNRPYDAIHYRIEFRLKDAATFENRLVMTLKPKKALSEVELDARGLEIEAVKVGGEPATFKIQYEPALRTGTLTVKPAKPLAASAEATIEIAYTGKINTSAHEGMFTVTDSDDPEALPYYFTQFEPTYAQAFFPCNDTPEDKATTEIFATVDSRYTVLSNGRKDKDEAFTEGGKNLRRVLWKQEQPHSPYLVALAVGVFEPLEVGGDTPATVWSLPGKKDRAFEAINSTRSALNFEAAFLGVKYPWAKYDQVAVPRFFWSGMENTSLVFNRESKFILDHKNDQVSRARITGLIAHEMAHQWFGNYVTLKWWDDTWLNEGFATFLGELAEDNYAENDRVEVSTAAWVNDEYFKQEAGPRSHALTGKGGASPEEVFDSISYLKGAMVLRMLDTWVGRAEMKKALKAYLEKHAFSNATSDDFFAAVYASTKKEKELKPFKEAWLKKKGYPVLFPEVAYSGGTATVTIRQQPAHADEKGPFVFKLPVVLHRDTEPKFTKEELITVDKPSVTVKIEVPAAPQWVNWNKNGAALVRVNTPSVSEQQWVDGARFDPDPVWRLMCTWVLLGELANPAMKEETRPTDGAYNTLLDVLAKDPSPYVREQVLIKLATSRWKKLPADLGPTVFTLARKPDLAEDALGQIRVRRAAMTLLGKIDFPEGHKYLLAEVVKKDQDLNFLSALSDGVAHLGTPEALATIQAAMRTQKPRGYAWYRNTAEALASLENVDAVKAIRDLLKDNAGNNEMTRNVLWRLEENAMLKAAPEFAEWVKDSALDEQAFPENIRAQMIDLLESSKSDQTKAALTVISEKSSSDRLKSSADHLLASNFPAKPVPAAAPKKKK